MFEFSLLAQATEVVRQSVEVAADAAPTVVYAPVPVFMLLLTVFVLAVFVGVEIINKIPPTLHTPLMSGSNAISGITVLGAILAAGSGSGFVASILGVGAIVLATINVVGGFVVTHRMLAMFRRKK
jgi:H+-translocating NAD(P) transhydrogenase subunit alpha